MILIFSQGATNHDILILGHFSLFVKLVHALENAACIEIEEQGPRRES